MAKRRVQFKQRKHTNPNIELLNSQEYVLAKNSTKSLDEDQKKLWHDKFLKYEIAITHGLSTTTINNIVKMYNALTRFFVIEDISQLKAYIPPIDKTVNYLLKCDVRLNATLPEEHIKEIGQLQKLLVSVMDVVSEQLWNLVWRNVEEHSRNSLCRFYYSFPESVHALSVLVLTGNTIDEALAYLSERGIKYSLEVAVEEIEDIVIRWANIVYQINANEQVQKPNSIEAIHEIGPELMATVRRLESMRQSQKHARNLSSKKVAA